MSDEIKTQDVRPTPNVVCARCLKPVVGQYIFGRFIYGECCALEVEQETEKKA